MAATSTISVNTGSASRYRICAKTVMDTSDPYIEFDEDGVSNYWRSGIARLEAEIIRGEAGLAHARRIAESIRAESKTKRYDCLIGVSGGVDSSYVAYWTRKLGLRPLAVHLDNGWNSELAVSNIEALVTKLDIDLHTVVLDWEEFRDIQRSFFLASVPNCEMPTDHAITATLFSLARKHGIRHIISGANVVTEGIYQANIGHDNKDWSHIADLHRRFGQRKVSTFPHLSVLDFARSIVVDRIRFIPILNYLDYNREQAIATLEREFGWRNYGRKHGESTFTRFFQEHYLPAKFGIDKRRMHYSSMICAGQITREDALRKLEEPLYEPDELRQDIEFVRKKLQFSEKEFEAIMKTPPKSHHDYRIGALFQDRYKPIYSWARRVATARR